MDRRTDEAVPDKNRLVETGERQVVQLGATVPEPPRGRILVVDDEPMLRALIARMLASRYEVVTAQSADAARAILEKDDEFDVVLCDLMMPGMTGMELHEWLVAKDPELAERVIFLTGGAFSQAAAEYIQHVANRILEKPFDWAKLDEAVSAGMKG